MQILNFLCGDISYYFWCDYVVVLYWLFSLIKIFVPLYTRREFGATKVRIWSYRRANLELPECAFGATGVRNWSYFLQEVNWLKAFYGVACGRC